jgi:hypothetical protein
MGVIEATFVTAMQAWADPGPPGRRRLILPVTHVGTPSMILNSPAN